LEGNEEGEFGGRSKLVGVEVQRGKEVFHRRAGLYPRSEERAADEDARARPSKQAAAWPGAWRCWSQQLSPGGLQCIPPCSSTVASHIQLFCCFAKFSQNLNWSQIFTKMKVVQNFKSYKSSLIAQSSI